MGISADVQWRGWLPVETFFTAFFFLEVCLKVRLAGCGNYCGGSDCLWNWFDVSIVASALLDLVLETIVTTEKGLNNIMVFRVARLARLTKMMRLLRLLRLRVFKELALLVKGVIAGLRTLFWAIVLLVFVSYAVGVLLRQTVGEYRHEVHDQYGTILFSSVPWSMFMVFRCITTSCDLPDGTPLDGHLYEMYGLTFVVGYSLTIIFVIFGIFNLIAATFVENVMEAARQKRQLTSEDEAARVFTKLRQLVLKFGGTKNLAVVGHRQGGKIRTSIMNIVADTVASPPEVSYDVAEVHFQCGGQVTREMFSDVMQDPEVHALFDDLEVHITDRGELFDIIDADGNGSIDVSELILGILKLRSGGADKSDMVATILGIRSIQKTSTILMETLCDTRRDIEAIQNYLETFRNEARFGNTPDDA